MKECEQVERTRHRIISERARLLSSRVGSTAGGTSSVNNLPGGVGPSVVNNNAGNGRQQVMSPSPSSSSQPSISGYSNNQQPPQPHMPFVPRQPMFGLGPRLPLTAIQPSSSNPSNVMFNAAGNAQPTLGHPMLRPVHGTSSGLG